jgi:hypothetical protein
MVFYKSIKFDDFLEPDNPSRGTYGSPCDPLPFKGGILREPWVPLIRLIEK